MGKEKKPINERVAMYRSSRNMNQNTLADLLKMKRTTYSQLEREGNISAEKLLAIAEILKVHPMDILVGEDERMQYDRHYPIEIKRNPFEPPEGIGNIGAKQSPFNPAPTIYSSWEENYFKTIHQLSEKDKTEVFTLVDNKFNKNKK